MGAGSCCSLTQALPGPPRGGLTSAVPLAQAAGVAGPFIIGEVDEELTGGEVGGLPVLGSPSPVPALEHLSPILTEHLGSPACFLLWHQEPHL